MSSRVMHFNLTLALGLALLSVVGQADAQTTRPFKVTGKGNIPILPLYPGGTGEHTAKGEATYLGRYEGDGCALIGNFISANEAKFRSKEGVPFEFRGAHRSLKFTYGVSDDNKPEGIVTLYPVQNKPGYFIAVWDAQFRLAETSGRVVAGEFRMIATTAPFFLGGSGPPQNVKYKWVGKGTITFSNGKKDK